MTGMGIMTEICTSSSPYPIEKIRDSLYPYPYPVNAGIPHQNMDEFGQYPWRRVYLPSLDGNEAGHERVSLFHTYFRGNNSSSFS